MAGIRANTTGIYPFVQGITSYREKAEGSPSFSGNFENTRAERRIFIPWKGSLAGADLAVWQAFVDFLGYSTVVTRIDGSKYISRIPPASMPGWASGRIPGTQALGQPGTVGWIYCTDITRAEGDRPAGNLASLEAGGQVTNVAESAASGNTVGTYQEALLNVVYSPLKHNVLTDAQLFAANASDPFLSGTYSEATLCRYVEIDVQAAGKYQVFKGLSTLSWDVAGNLAPSPMANDIPILLNEGDLTIRWKQVPAEGFPDQAILQTVGKTNHADFGTRNTSLSGIRAWFPAGTLLCLYPRRRLYRGITGTFFYDIDYRFKIYPYGANSFFRAFLPRIPFDWLTMFLTKPTVPGICGPVTSIAPPTATPTPPLPGTCALVTTPSPHGLLDGYTISLVYNPGITLPDGSTISGDGSVRPVSSAGTWQVSLAGLAPNGNQFYLKYTDVVSPPQQIFQAGAIGFWTIAPGFFPASRSGHGADPIFGPADYSLLFQPE